MSDQSASISFKVVDNGVGSYIEKIKQQQASLVNDMIRGAQQQTGAAKEQLSIIERQIQALERKSALEKQYYLRQLRETRDNRLDRIEDIENRGVRDIWARTDINNRQKEKLARHLIERRNELKDRVNADYGEKVNKIKDQYDESRLTNKLLRDNVEAIKTGSKDQLNQMRKGDENIVNAVDENGQSTERLANQLASQQYISEKEKDKKEAAKEKGGVEQWLAFSKALAVDRGLGLATQIPNARNELDFIKPLTSIMGLAIGGLAGNLMDMMNIKVFGNGLGNTNFGALGTQLGEKAGEFFGSAMERAWQAREDLTNTSYRLQALTGKDIGVEKFAIGSSKLGGRGLNMYSEDLSRYGVSYQEAAEIQLAVAQRQGYGRNIASMTRGVVTAEHGLGVSKETSYALMELQRSSKESDKDFLRTLTGILESGKDNIFKEDRAYLNEFVVRNFSQVQRELLKTQSAVSSGTTFDILRRFDSLGGEFSARDPRSVGLINQIQGALANPSSDNMRALSFQVMRRNNPGLGIAGILEEQQKGLGSPAYLRSMLGAVDSMGGDTDMKIMNIAGMFGLQGNMRAARRIYENMDKLMKGDISTKDLLGSDQSLSDVDSKAVEQTGRYTASAAEIQDKFIQDVTQGVNSVRDKMKELFGDMTEELKKFIHKQLNGNGGSNTTSTPSSVRQRQVTGGGIPGGPM